MASFSTSSQGCHHIKQILDLKQAQEINIDLSKGIEDLRKYPLVFGDPLDPKWQSVIKKIGSQKLTEREVNSEGSVSAKLGLGKFFNFDANGSSKRDSRFKEMIQFDIEGEFYIPKAIKFNLFLLRMSPSHPKLVLLPLLTSHVPKIRPWQGLGTIFHLPPEIVPFNMFAGVQHITKLRWIKRVAKLSITSMIRLLLSILSAKKVHFLSEKQVVLILEDLIVLMGISVVTLELRMEFKSKSSSVLGLIG